MDRISSKGFTLVELMITLAVAAVLLSIGAPSFGKMVRDNRLVSEANALRGVLATARSAAQTQRAVVTVCRSADGLNCSTGNWSAGFLAFIDTDQDGILDDPDDVAGEQILHWHQGQSALVDIGFSQAGDQVRFDSRGNALGSSGTFTLCDIRGATAARGLIVSPVGAIRAARDLGAGGGNVADVVDDHAGADVACNA